MNDILKPHFGTIFTHLDGTRDRTMTRWQLVPMGNNQFYLAGQVLSEYGQALSHTRITTTSPIKYRENRTLITESDSRYRLLDPHPSEDKDSYLKIPEKKSYD